MKHTIITPSYNQFDYLTQCIASVADQCGENCTVYHHVQDGCSTDGTCEFLEKLSGNDESMLLVHGEGKDLRNHHLSTYQPTFVSESDAGMYDALNKGADFVLQNQVDECLLKNNGAMKPAIEEESPNNHEQSSINSLDRMIAWLNCDEQYLPGTLQKVADYFRKNPETDILFGGMLVIDETGELLSCRRAMPMRKVFLEASYLYNYSCAMFFRRSLWEKLGGFDTAYKNAGDEDLIRRALASGAKTAVLDEYLSVFTYGEGNLSSEPSAVEEHRLLKQNNSGWVQLFRPVINAIRLGEKWIRGGHRQKGPIEYEIYVEGSVERKKFVCENPSCQWPGHTKPYMLHHRLDT